MVDCICTVRKSSTSRTGYEIEDNKSGVVLDMPSICIEDFDLGGKVVRFADMYKKMSTIRIALAGVTNSLNVIDYNYFDRNSVFKSFGLAPSGTIDDSIDGYLENAAQYEAFHTIYMDRDVSGNDNSIHAYIYTPTDGPLRCKFDKAIRLEAKRNNVTYWVDDYKLSSGSNGGKYVIPDNPIEIKR